MWDRAGAGVGQVSQGQGSSCSQGSRTLIYGTTEVVYLPTLLRVSATSGPHFIRSALLLVLASSIWLKFLLISVSPYACILVLVSPGACISWCLYLLVLESPGLSKCLVFLTFGLVLLLLHVSTSYFGL